jgi:hypothetical protein
VLSKGAAWLSRVWHGSVRVQRGSVRVLCGSVRVQRGSVRVLCDTVGCGEAQ